MTCDCFPDTGNHALSYCSEKGNHTMNGIVCINTHKIMFELLK